MTTDQMLVQLTGRVAAIEFLLAQTMVLAVLDRPDPSAALAVMRESFDNKANNIEATLPESLPAALEAGTRIFSVVEATIAAGR